MKKNDSIKLSPQKSEEYHDIIALLKKLMSENNTKNVSYHTYQCKSEKPYEVIVRGLNLSNGKTEIIMNRRLG